MFSKCCASVPTALPKKMLKKKTGCCQNTPKRRLDKENTAIRRNQQFYAQSAPL
jgi:hypothetical protein